MCAIASVVACYITNATVTIDCTIKVHRVPVSFEYPSSNMLLQRRGH